MRRVLLTAVAVAPLLAMAGAAEAACPAAGTATNGADIATRGELHDRRRRPTAPA